MFTRLAQEEEPDACNIGNGKQFIVHIIRSVSMMQDGAHDCNGNMLCLFRWIILLVCHQSCRPSQKSMFPWLSIWMSGTPIGLCTLPTSCGASETEPDHVGSWLVERRPSRILLPKTCGCRSKSVEVSQGSTKCTAQNSNWHPQCLTEAAD